MNYITVSEAAEKWGVSKSLVRRYLAQNRIPKVKCNDGIWSIPETAKKPPKLPNTPVETEELCILASKLVNQKKKRNYHGLYDYVVINLTYSSCRMASNRLTRGQVETIFKKGKVLCSFEPLNTTKKPPCQILKTGWLCISHADDNKLKAGIICLKSISCFW